MIAVFRMLRRFDIFLVAATLGALIRDSFMFQTPTKAIGSNMSGSQVSVASTPANSVTSTDHTCSSDWPDPPEQPICSTEDEAGSLFTDSGESLPGLKPS